MLFRSVIGLIFCGLTVNFSGVGNPEFWKYVSYFQNSTLSTPCLRTVFIEQYCSRPYYIVPNIPSNLYCIKKDKQIYIYIYICFSGCFPALGRSLWFCFSSGKRSWFLASGFRRTDLPSGSVPRTFAPSWQADPRS